MLTARRRTAAAVAAAVAGSLLLVSCGGSGGGSSDAHTLRLWHYEGPDSAMGVAWNEAIKEFKKSHPGVKVKFEEKGFEQIQKTAPMVLNSDDAPDVMEYNKGNATAGLLSKQGLLTDLTDEAHQARLGQGDQPAGVRTTSQYYAQPGSWVPASGTAYRTTPSTRWCTTTRTSSRSTGSRCRRPFDELTAAMGTFVKKGVTPLANGGAEYLAQQYLYQLALSKADRSWVDAYELYKGKTDFHDAAWTYAADHLRRLGEEGLHREDFQQHEGGGRRRRPSSRARLRSCSRAAGGTGASSRRSSSTGAPSCGPARS